MNIRKDRNVTITTRTDHAGEKGGNTLLLQEDRFPDDVLRAVMDFLGPNQFRFVAGTCRRWRRIYERQNDLSTHTSMQSVTESPSKCQLYYSECVDSDDVAKQQRICRFSALYGRLSVLQWGREEMNFEWDARLCGWASKNGHLNVLQWARKNGCEWDTLTCAYAALNGHLAVLQWARQNGCPWDSWTCAWARNNGHLHVLQWARENGCEERASDTGYY